MDGLTLEHLLPQVREFVHASAFEKQYIQKHFRGKWEDLPVTLTREIGNDQTLVEFTFSRVGTRLIAFYQIKNSNVDDFIRSFGVRKTEAIMF